MDWIPVGERLPEEDEKVLLFALELFYDTQVDCGVYSDGEWQIITNGGWDSCDVTHWQPLPKPPENENS